MYHSPGLRDGVSTQGMCVRPCPPEVLGAESIRTRFTGRGINSGARRSLCSTGVMRGHFWRRLSKSEANTLEFSRRRLALEWIEEFALPCRLTGTETAHRKKSGSIWAREWVAQRNAGMLHAPKERSQLELLIFTAGNLPEGQQ
jgi:hypothetical protein